MELDESDHKKLALWAADVADRVLHFFEEVYPGDDRPRKAVEAARAWARGDIAVGDARAAASGAQAAAREADRLEARAAARAAGHAAATAQVPTHAKHAADYAVTAACKASLPAECEDAATEERAWQTKHLIKRLRPAVFPAKAKR